MGRKGYPAIYLLAVVLAVASISASAADPDIPGIWTQTFSLKHPIREFYLASSKALGYAPGHSTSQYAQFDVWGKYIYETPENIGGKLVSEEWVALHLDCSKMTYVTYRYMQLDDQGQVLSDSSAVDKPRPVPKDWDDPNHLPLAKLTAGAARGFACAFDSE